MAIHAPITGAPTRATALPFKHGRKPNTFTLADDPDFMGLGAWGDVDAEVAWAEYMDQTRLRSSYSEDDEEDDPDTGIDDCCCDARDEDGI